MDEELGRLQWFLDQISKQKYRSARDLFKVEKLPDDYSGVINYDYLKIDIKGEK